MKSGRAADDCGPLQLDFTNTGPAGFGSVLLEGITTDRAVWAGNTLELVAGRSLVDTVRCAGNIGSLTFQQTATGVAISQNNYSEFAGAAISVLHGS